MSLDTFIDTLPDGFQDTSDLIDRLDHCFLAGFSRLGAEHISALAELADVFAGSPLAQPLQDAVEALSRAAFSAPHFVTVAIARASLQGAQYDALMTQACDALGYARHGATAPPTEVDASGPVTHWLEASRQWLMEIAVAGFSQLHASTLTPFNATLEQLQGSPEAVRQSMILTGLMHELLDSLPTSKMPALPLKRWVDLWTRAMVSCIKPHPTPAMAPVSGDVCLIGADLRHHSHAVSACFYGVLTGATPARVVRLTCSAYKVDVIRDDAIWQVFPKRYSTLFEAWVKHKTLTLDEAQLRDTGDLIWDEAHITLGATYDPMDVARAHLTPQSELLVADTSPPDRHPVQLAIPIYVEPAKTPALKLNFTRVSEYNTVHHAKQLAEVIGLLSMDNEGWEVTPLCGVAKGGKTLLRAGADASTTVARSSSLSILRERASKLLRSKS